MDGIGKQATNPHAEIIYPQITQIPQITVHNFRILQERFCVICAICGYLSWEAPAVFKGHQERLDHLGISKVAVEAVQLLQPEVVTGEVFVWSSIGIASQVSEVLHQYKRLVKLLGSKHCILRDPTQRPCSRRCITGITPPAKLIDGFQAIVVGGIYAGVAE